MSQDRTGIFSGDDPLEIARDWIDAAWKSEPRDANATQLATVDAAGMPNVRTVLLKDIEDDAFVFYTNYTSAKAEEIEHAGKAAFVIHWKSLNRQVRVRGTVTREDGPRADAYFASRALQSRIGAWASPQSRPLESRADLEGRVAKIVERFGDDPPRPPFWGGFRLRPVEIEFWAEGDFRLHDRFGWQWTADGWNVTRLAP